MFKFLIEFLTVQPQNAGNERARRLEIHFGIFIVKTRREPLPEVILKLNENVNNLLSPIFSCAQKLNEYVSSSRTHESLQ